MPSDRRYSDHEIAAIFKQAAEAQHAARAGETSGDGLTLAELQAIGAESGIAPEYIARAAARAEQTRAPATTFLGQPITAGRTVELPGAFTDADWDRLVADLRETFRATGTIQIDGSLRAWRNGNLRALVEPTDTGHRLRLSTLKGNARTNVALGGFGGGAGVILVLMAVLTASFSDKAMGDLSVVIVTGALLLLAGLGSAGATAYQLRRWAAKRDEQMEAVAARALERALEGAEVSEAQAFEGDTTADAPDLDLDAVAPDTAVRDAARSPVSSDALRSS
jgi:hypothetical protein